jgi:hypothetical protein
MRGLPVDFRALKDFFSDMKYGGKPSRNGLRTVILSLTWVSISYLATRLIFARGLLNIIIYLGYPGTLALPLHYHLAWRLEWCVVDMIGGAGKRE